MSATRARILATTAVIAWMAIGAPVRAEGIAVGSFCIEGVAAQDLPRERIIVDGGEWQFRRYREAEGAAPGRVIVFDRFITKDPLQLPTCAGVRSTAAEQGARVLLEGTVRRLRLKVGHLAAGGQNSFVIAPQDLEVEIGHVTSGFSTIGGGRLELAGSRAWIGNPGRINITPTGMAGTLRIESWDRTLQGATVALAGGADFTASFRQRGDQNVVIDFDTSSGAARLHRADMVATDIELPAGDIAGELAALRQARLHAREARLTARDGRAAVQLADALGEAEGAELGGSELRARSATTRFAWSAAGAAAEQSAERFSAAPLAFTDLSLSSDAGQASLGGATLASGSYSARFPSLTDRAVRGRVDFTAPNVEALSFALPDGAVRSLRIDMQGTREALAVRGDIAASRLAVGGLTFDADSTLSFAKAATASEISIPINLSLGDISGSFTLADRDQRALIRATLRRLALRGNMVLDTADLARSRLEIPAGGFAFDLDAAAAIEPILAGTRPTLAQAGVRARNATAVTVSRDGAAGSVDVAMPLLVAGQPVFRIGDAGTRAALSLDLRANDVEFRYDLAESSLRLRNARFELRDADFAPLEPGYEADLDSFIVTEPRLRLASLVLDVRNGLGTATGDGLSLHGDRLRNAPENRGGIELNGRLAAPLAAARLAAGFTVDEQGFELRLAELGDVTAGISDATLDLGGGARLEAADIRLAAAQVRSRSEPRSADNGLFFTGLRIRGGGRLSVSGDFRLTNEPRLSDIDALFNGRSDRLDGLGTARLNGFIGELDSALDTGFGCASGSNLQVPIRATLASGPSDLTIEADAGEMSLEGSFLGFAVGVASRSESSCSSTPRKHVIQERVMGSMTGLCPTWRKPFRTCRWSTVLVPEISVTLEMKAKVLLLAAGVMFSNPRVRFERGGQRFCNVGRTYLVQPVIVGGVYPQLSNPTLLNDAINLLVEGAAIAFESTIANVALTTVTPFVNMVGQVPYYCFRMGGNGS